MVPVCRCPPYGVLGNEVGPVDGAVEEPGNGEADGDVEYVGADAGAHRHVPLALLSGGGGGGDCGPPS